MPEHKPERRSALTATVPTPMMKAVGGLEKWKLNVLFVVGLVGMIGMVYWFAFGDRGHEHSLAEFIMAGIMFGVCAFFAFPLGVTRLVDKYLPDKWRKERRSGTA